MTAFPIDNAFKADVLDLAPVIVAVHDTEHNIVWANMEYQKATGMSLDEIAGIKCYSAWGLSKPCKACPVTEAIETGEQREAELTPQNQDRCPMHQGAWLSKAVPLRDDSGNVIGAIETAYEITGRKEMETELRESRAILQAAMDHSHAGIAIADAPDGKLRYVNDAGLNIRGKSKEEIVNGVGINDYVASWQILHLDGTPYEPEEVPLARAVMYGEVSSKEFIVRRPNQEDRMVLANAAPIYDEKGKVSSGIVVFLDVTEHKQAEIALKTSEQRYRTLFENMYDGVAVYRPDKDGEDFIFMDMNQSGQALSQVRKEEIIGKRLTEVFPGVEEMGLLDVLRRVYRRGTTEHLPMTQYKDDRITEWVDNTVFRLPSNELVAVYRDETERHVAEQEIKALTAELERRVVERTRALELANSELEAFAYSVSHDLKAPLRAISGFSEIIAERFREDLNEQGRHYFDNIVEASDQMGKLIEDLLSYSRLGRKAIHKRRVDLHGIFERILKNLQEKILETGAVVDIPESLPTISSDDTLLHIIFGNIIENAMTYTKPGIHPKIEITISEDLSGTTIVVQDRGIGIASEYHHKIFDIFQRLQPQSKYPGTGIGLGLVKKAVGLLGGSIHVQSQPEKGAAFSVRLPSVAEQSFHEKDRT